MKNIKLFEKQISSVLDVEFHLNILSSYKNKKVILTFADKKLTVYAGSFKQCFRDLLDLLPEYVPSEYVRSWVNENEQLN